MAQSEVVELLVELIRNACVNDGTADSGGEARSVATLESYFGRPGQIFEPHPGRQSVAYRVPGTSDGPSLLLMGHLDVVPANPAGWSVDPFGGEIRDGFVWGRGAVDMLNLTAAMAVVFKRHLEGAAPRLGGDLVYLGVADEEAGGALGAEYILETEPAAVLCDYVLTEIASPSLRTADGEALPVTVAEKGPFWRHLATSGIPGHGSQPYGTRNALVPLAAAIGRLVDQPTPVLITEEWKAFVARLPVADDLAADLVDPDRVDAAIDRVAADDPGLARWAHACTHLTISPNMLSAGVKANVVPDAAGADVDIRLLPGQDEQALHDHFRKVLGPGLYEEIEFTPVLDHAGNGSPAEGPLWEAIGEAYESLSGTRNIVPTLIPVTTDARFFRDRGSIAYGVGLFDDRVGFGDLIAMFHGNDERVSLGSMDLTTQLLDRTLEAFGRRTA